MEWDPLATERAQKLSRDMFVGLLLLYIVIIPTILCVLTACVQLIEGGRIY